MPFRVVRPPTPPVTRYRGLVEHLGFRLKRYASVDAGSAFAEERFRSGRGLALSALPEPAVQHDRPGVGLVLEHQLPELDRVTVAWWDRERELPLRVIVGDDAGWRPAREGESLCVWDLAIVAAERDAYVETVLTPGGGGIDAYLARSWDGALRG
ncbi:hypothetical protein [Anaeromyxobacter dehalogenans]|uniref:Uncharacterized protein n=1 Tax=Anaeromyxobacter dehalogenans (strain 2CP-C) TaxID=290397 RepID=Q2IF29_ANADE|nr:hypothetical protein [Anaeromyxobacter dehalogenans]ABC83191.1 hypothetical protein Adeh_3424 [Anaeromyxobacter dehalogenans 2CP-C]